MLSKLPKKGQVYDFLHRTVVYAMMSITVIGTAFIGFQMYTFVTVIRPLQMEKTKQEKEEGLALEQLESERELLKKQREAETLI